MKRKTGLKQVKPVAGENKEININTLRQLLLNYCKIANIFQKTKSSLNKNLELNYFRSWKV